MGKRVTVIAGFTDVSLPAVLTVPAPTPPPVQVMGTKAYSSGQSATLTDAEYAALPASVTRCLGSPSNVADPARPSSDKSASSVTVATDVHGTYTASYGTNAITLTDDVTTFNFPASPVGETSTVTLVITQGGTGSYTVTWPSGVNFAGGTAPTLTTTVGGVDRLVFASRGDGTNWDLVGEQLALA